MNRMEIFQKVYGKDYVFTVIELDRLQRVAELIVQECASIVYRTCQDGDAGAQAILYEFDIDNARSQK